MSPEELARRALSRPLTPERAQKLADRLHSERYARQVVEAMAAQVPPAEHEKISEVLSHTRRNRFGRRV